MARTAMPQLYGVGLATGELAHEAKLWFAGGLKVTDQPIFSYFIFEVPKNMTNTIEATATVVMMMKSIIRLDLSLLHASIACRFALTDRRAITAHWSIYRTESSLAHRSMHVVFESDSRLTAALLWPSFTTMHRKLAKRSRFVL